MIATIDEIKKLINIAEGTDTYDAFIEATIPSVEEQLFDRVNTHFENFDVQIDAGSVVFSKSANTITIPGYSDLTTEYFHADCHILIEGSFLNENIVKVKSVATNVFTLYDFDNLVNETSKNTVYVTKCDVPKGLILLYAKMIAHNMILAGLIDPAVKSEKVGDYSITYAGGKDGSLMQYPDDIEKMFTQYQRPKFVKSFS